jgi:hypothetical protein
MLYGMQRTERAEMPRRTIVVMIAAGTIFSVAAARPALAQPQPDTRPVQLYIDLGYVNLFDYPKWINLGPELELRLGRLLTVNPEVSIWIRQTYGGKVKVVPGATVNLRLRRFFVGVGAVRRISDWTESAGGWLIPKAQVGYLAGPTRLTLSCYYLNTTKDVVAGLTIGMGIGRRPRD